MNQDEITRFNELRFKDLATHFLLIHHSIKPFHDFIKLIYSDFNEAILEKMLMEIHTIKYTPSKPEQVKLYHKAGFTLEEIAKKLGYNINTLRQKTTAYGKNEAICPRTNEEEAKELNTFFEKYDIIFTQEVIKR